MSEKSMEFKDLELSEKVKKGLEELGFITLTPIQAKSIPSIIEGRDIIGQSQTGTGKTAAYGLPMINMIDKSSKKVQGLILCPTRELALQVVGEIRKFSKYEEGMKSLAVYGGESIERQIGGLKNGVQIVVGTPGRIMDHMRRKTLKLDNVKMVVLDEADEMLNMGFEEDINTILTASPEDRQTVLFSATMNKRILGVAKKYLTDPVEVKIKAKELTVDRIEQVSIELKQSMKNEVLSRIIDFNNPKKAVVFCNTKRKAEELTDVLKQRGYTAECLNGDVKQEIREKVMKKFKAGDFRVLIATDVMARGIDVDELELVVNYDVPQEEEYYVHRIGRTGRNGNGGKAYTFVVGKERVKLESIERYAKTRINPGEIPTDAEMFNIRRNNIVSKLQAEITDNKVLENEKASDIVSEIYTKLTANNDSENLLKSLIGIALSKDMNYNQLMSQTEIETTRTSSKKNSSGTNNSGANDSNSKYKRFFLSLGKLDAIKAKDIVGSVTSNTIISGNEIGKIDVLDKFSFIEVPTKYADDLLNGMTGKQIKGKDVRVELVKKSRK